MKVPRWGRLVGHVCVIAVAIAASGFAWFRVRGSGDSAVDVRGWPEQIAMVCQGCGHGFRVASADYLEEVQAKSAGRQGRLQCPACQGVELLRVEHLSHQQHRFEGGAGSG